jgi:transcriptional regulator with XRE-family HTH domain
MNTSEAKIARVRAGYRQIDLAREVGISPALVSMFEQGDADPSPGLAKKMNELLGQTVYPEEQAK